MYQEPTELLCIGYLTGLILILKFKIRYIDTKHQLADVLTKVISHVMSRTIFFTCSISATSAPPKNSSLISCPKTMAKRMQEQAGEDRCVAKSKNYSDEPVFSCSDKFFIREKSDCVQRSGDTHSYGET